MMFFSDIEDLPPIYHGNFRTDRDVFSTKSLGVVDELISLMAIPKSHGSWDFSLWAMAAPEDIPHFQTHPHGHSPVGTILSSSKEIKPILSLSTAHRHNIFDAHLTGRQVVSCGADGFVCKTYLDASWASERLFTPVHVETTQSLAFKMDFLPQSRSVFLVTFGDGFVRQFDLRVATQLAAVNCDDVGLVGLGVEPRDGHTLALGGNDPFLRIYDLRKLSFHQESNLMNMITTPVVFLHSTAEMIRKHKKIISFSRFFSGHSDVCISGVCWDSCGRLLANYRGGDIELFDFRSDPVPEGDAPEATPWMDLSDSSLPTSRVYLNSIRSYKGRINEQTCAKEVRFLCQGAAVASGGDCGHFYIWSTESTVPWSQI